MAWTGVLAYGLPCWEVQADNSMLGSVRAVAGAIITMGSR